MVNASSVIPGTGRRESRVHPKRRRVKLHPLAAHPPAANPITMKAMTAGVKGMTAAMKATTAAMKATTAGGKRRWRL
jgi:hypothetical protein